MANTYTLIASSTAGSGGVANFEFTSIPATYTDLKLVVSLRNSANNVYNQIYFNSDTTNSNYRYRDIYGTGSAVGSSNYSIPYGPLTSRSSYTNNVFGNADIYIPNYTSSNYKSASIDGVSENNGTEAYSNLAALLWQNTAAITSIKLVPDGAGNWDQYSTAYLYGIKNS